MFVDTPGLFAPKRRLDRAMTAAAWGAAADADALALLVDARAEIGAAGKASSSRRPPISARARQAILATLKERPGPKVLILNKIDLVERAELLALSARLNAALPFQGDLHDQRRDRRRPRPAERDLAGVMPKGPWLYPEDQIADAPMRSLAAEITREKLFERLHDELPYQTTVETEFLEGPARRLGAHRADDLRHARQPQEDRHRRGRAHAEGDRLGRAQGDRRGQREQGAPVPVRQGARELARRSRALSRDGAGVPEGIGAASLLLGLTATSCRTRLLSRGRLFTL